MRFYLEKKDIAIKIKIKTCMTFEKNNIQKHLEVIKWNTTFVLKSYL